MKWKRVNSVDSLRGLGVLLMVFWHFFEWLSIESWDNYILVGKTPCYGLAPPIFFIVTGLSLHLSTHSRLRRKQSLSSIRGHVVKRYSSLILIGILLNVLTCGMNRAWLWNALENIGMCNIIVYFVSGFIKPNYTLFILAFAFPVSYPFLKRVGVVDSSPWPLKTMFFRGGFPLFLWIPFMFIGKGLGVLITNNLYSPLKLQITLLTLGLSLTLVSLMLNWVGYTIDLYSVSATYVAFTSGLTTLFLFLFYLAQDSCGKDPLPLKPLVKLGKTALGIFIWHYIAFYKTIDYMGLIKSMPVSTAFPISLVLVGTISMAAHTWLKIKGE